MTTSNPYLTLPLDGVRLIEASAGTGKTFTLSTLFTRLVVERRLRPGQILAVTFTEAATQELRKRIRERLVLAAELVGAEPSADDAPDRALSIAIVRQHLARGEETADALQRRLRLAAEEIDLAAIFTIHGFCARVLSEHALESGHGFAAAELLANTKALHEEVAADRWRRHANDRNSLDALTLLWSSPKMLAKSLPELAGPLRLLPQVEAEMLEDPRPLLAAASQALAGGVHRHGEEYAKALLAAVEADILTKVSYKADGVVALLEHLRSWAAAPETPGPDPAIRKFTLEALTRGTKKDHQGKTPTSPLQPLVANWVAAYDRFETWRRARAIALLHTIRAEARQRIALFKHQRRLQTYDDMIDGVADALDGPHRDRLVAGLRQQYRIALVDEFQDTDERQWSIFRCVFGEAVRTDDQALAPALFLIGDPKQAIYGFRGGDVHTYLRAREEAEVAPPLDRNFRSRPGVLRAIQALYDNAGKQAFAGADIDFIKVHPGDRRHDIDYTRNGQPAPALTLRIIESDADKPRADDSREEATAACVADIHRVLSEARAGTALIDGEPVQPGDIAVLVRSHKEATRIRQALSAAGIPAVAAGKQSLFATDEAREVHVLLDALLNAADDGRMRGALSTVLVGLDAPAIAALESDGEALRTWQQRVFAWRERWERAGAFALIAELCAEHAERLLLLADGERRLTNYLQLAEQLQQAATHALGMHGLFDWLQQQIARADADDETQLLRLESDAHRVQIVTLHKSKGLEYPLVYLPFVGIGTGGKNTEAWRVVHDGHQRELHWKLDKDDKDWKQAGTQARSESEAEDARLLYVGLTRAEHALWIAAGNLAGFDKSRLAPMLEGHVEALAGHPDVAVVHGHAEAPPSRLRADRAEAVQSPRIAQRRIAADWWVYSFTQLANADAGQDSAAAATEADGAAADEPAQPAPDTGATDEVGSTDDYDPRFAGSRFGNVLHEALEQTDFAAWSHWQPGDDAPAGQGQVLLDALGKEGYAAPDLEDGLAVLTSLVGRTLTVDLPEGGPLHALPEDERRAEIEFHFAMRPTAVSALVELLHAHGVVRERHGFGTRRSLEGLMTGKIDLTYLRDARWHVLDYKTNRLPGYDAPALAAAMAHGEYDLQALIYTVALHRWLRFRLGHASDGGGYDYDRDFGGIRYLFCRGLDPAGDPSRGVFVHRYPPELVHALDALFAGEPPSPQTGQHRGGGSREGAAG